MNNVEDLKKLLAEGREGEAQELLEQFLASSISPKEQGQAIIAWASAHMEAQNTINEEYVRVLKNAAAELAAMKKDETRVTDAINLVKTRKQLQGD